MIVASVRILGPLNVATMKDCIDTLGRRHESLRTRIIVEGGVPQQHILDKVISPLEIIDLSGLPAKQSEHQATSIAQDFIDRDVDLSVGPLFEAQLIILSSNDHVLILALDHIISDGTSNSILNRELWTLYGQLVRGEAPSLPPIPAQFGDYAIWLHGTQDAWLEEHAPYWKARLFNAPSSYFPSSLNPMSQAQRVYEKIRFPLGTSLSMGLRAIANRERTLLSSIALTVYVATISCLCNQNDVVVAFTSHGRTGHRSLANMIGLLAYSLYLRVSVTGHETFHGLLSSINLELRTAYQHQDHGRVSQHIYPTIADIGYNWASANWISDNFKRQSQPHRHSQQANDQLELQPFPLQRKAHAVIEGPKLVLAPTLVDGEIILHVSHWIDTLDRTIARRFCLLYRLLATEFARNPQTSLNSASLCHAQL